jgi:hypothetical protein
MDLDVFPNSVEYWGPNGMLFLRNVQVRWMPVQGQSRITIALERPGASGDEGIYAARIDQADVKARFPAPDLSAEFRLGGDWGYVELAGIGRYFKLDDNNPTDAFDFDHDIWGGGGSLSSNIRFGGNVLRLQGVYGKGIENYFNDAPYDVGARRNAGNLVSPVQGEALPIWSGTAFLDLSWTKQWTTSIGFSYLDIDNSDAQAANAFHIGQYALVNLLYSPVPSVLAGIEGLWGQRQNNADGFSVDDFRVQFSFKYSFNVTVGKPGGQE